MRSHWQVCARLLGLLVVVLGASLRTPAAQAKPPVDYVPAEVLVKLLRPADLRAVAADYNLALVRRGRLGAEPIYHLRITDAVAPPRRAAELLADPLGRVVYAEPNYLLEEPEGRQRSSWATGNAGLYTTQWVSDILHLPAAQRISRGSGVTVAVLDTGVDFRHPALAGRLLPGYDFVGQDADPSEEGVLGQDGAYGHGTHVAGLVALVAPEAQLLPLRVLDAEGVGSVWRLAQALAYALDPDADPMTADGAAVINLSISTRRPTQLLKELMEVAAGKDTVVVAAAGNSGAAIREYPAAEPVTNRLAVAASTAADTVATFSTYGPWVDLAAPGENIVSSVPGGGYGSWSGTSMATPLVAGVAALLRSSNPSLRAQTVIRRLEKTAVDIEGPVRQRVDAAAALAVAPRLQLPPPLLVEATDAAGAIVTYEVAASDRVDGRLVPSCSPAAGTRFGLGATVVTCWVTDQHEYTARNHFTVTVRDTTPPTLTVPGPLTHEATDASGVIVSYDVGAEDVVDGRLVPSCSPAAGTRFGLGATLVSCGATDAQGNTATASFTVTVSAAMPGGGPPP